MKSMRRKRLQIVCLLLVSLFVLAGCGSSKSDNDTSESKTESVEKSVSEKAETSKDFKIGVLLKPESNTYWSGMGAAIEEWAKENNVELDIYYAESEENISGQLEQMENMISKGYNAICAAPLSASNLVQGVVKATEAGIIVVNVDEQIDPDAVKEAGGAMYAQYTTDNILVGTQAATYITEQIGSGKVGIVEGTAGNATSQARTKGATDYFAEQDGIELVASQPGDWDRLTAQDVAASMITANPDLKAIYCCNDVMALGAVSAVQNANKQDDIVVVGTDATEDGINSVANGEETATVGQDNTGIGIKCCEAAVEAINNNWVPKDNIDENVPVIFIDSFLVTKDNASDYIK